MPYRVFAAKELADLLGVLSNPHRLRIIFELSNGECDVASLQALLGIAHSAVSQHLSLLRAHRLVAERKEGRRVYYHLRVDSLAHWLLQGLGVIEHLERGEAGIAELRTAQYSWQKKPT